MNVGSFVACLFMLLAAVLGFFWIKTIFWDESPFVWSSKPNRVIAFIILTIYCSTVGLGLITAALMEIGINVFKLIQDLMPR